MTEIREIASGLDFPEGPVALPNGDLLVVEIAAGRLTRVKPDGTKETVAEPGGGPNGAAIGPDGKCYLCNNGGGSIHRRGGRVLTGLENEDYTGGRIERVDLETGAVEVLYVDVDGVGLRGPNDIVFDRDGGFWFTDHGKTRRRSRDRTGVFYAKADGSFIAEAIFPIDGGPNGIGLSPDEKTLYVAETHGGRLWAYDISGPGEVAKGGAPLPWLKGRVIAAWPEYALFDSLAVEADGNICVATIAKGGITVAAPDGGIVEHVAMPDDITTNICFGGPDLKTAYITLSSTGRLVAMDWPRPGLALNFLNK